MNNITPIKRGPGRPKGSPNKIKAHNLDEPTFAPPPGTTMPQRDQSPPEPIYTGLVEAIINPGLPVKLRKSRQITSFGDTSKTYNDPAEQEIEWPAGWPLPTTGQVVLGPISGATNSVEFDLDNRVILITLR